MAVVPICYNMGYKDQSLLNPKGRHNEKGFMCSFNAVHENCSCFSPLSSESGRRGLNDSTGILLKFSKRRGAGFFQGEICNSRFMPSNMTEVSVQSSMRKLACHLRSSPSNAPEREKLYVLCQASKSSLNQKQLESLDTYFGKLKQDANQPSSVSLNKTEEFVDHSGTVTAKRVLGSLEDYLGKVKKDTKSKNYVSSASDGETTEAPSHSVGINSVRGQWKKLTTYMMLRNKDGEGGPKISYNETSDLYLISILVSMNIAVFLFGIASPTQKSDLELLSLPLAYGAKINHLILLGEWWRLVTPMFLHSGIFHISLGCWVLFTFGPRVCRSYGSFSFLLIYILGGIAGNLTSFLQTPEPTVGGTGPVFAIIGAWLIYQILNKEVIAKDDSENMLQKVLIATALSCLLSNFGLIDDWTHFGAAFTGTVYGFLTCPLLQMDDRSSQEEGIMLVSQYADPCKSIIVFSISLLVLSSLLFVIEPPLY
ncbi:RHOMBOID-like protein 9, chloroplastic isoform X2 [Actinidia eriantha]|nr:RHOMBOID-like protein 9, chloroplastic isoform X2 [Actinidia eriantha]XP_057462522.1 RHOMBOID-like protein 9, chloroplastic isoform X2 [Actinidia eriantha]